MDNLKTFARLGIVYLEEAVFMAMGDEALKTWEINKRLKRHPNRVVGEPWIRMEDT